MKLVVISLSLTVSLYATSLDSIIDTALTENNSIKSIQNLLDKKDLIVQRSANFDNPFVKLGLNDLRVDDIKNRSLEPMQTNYLLVKQKIPAFGKRVVKKEIATKQKDITFFSLQEAKSSLVATIKSEAINYARIKSLLKINKRFSKKIKELKKIQTSYSQFQENSHTALIQSELLLSSLKVKEELLKNLLKNTLYNLSYLSNMQIKSIDTKLEDVSLPSLEELKTSLANNFQANAIQKEFELSHDKLKLAKLSKNIDPVVEVGYFQRNSYEDYISVGVGFSIPIYGTEDTKIQEQKIQKASIQAKLSDYRLSLKNKLFGLFEDFKATQKMIKIIKRSTLKEINHLLENDKSKISSGEQMSVYFETLKQKFALEELLVNKKASIMITKAKIEKLIGKLR